jgi:hypothetical protein
VTSGGNWLGLYRNSAHVQSFLHAKDQNLQFRHRVQAEKDGHVSWQDQKDQSAITMPAPKGGGWVVVGFDAGRLSMSVAGDGMKFSKPMISEVSKQEVAVDFSGACDVFIGCRSHRKGILKTLGVSRIHDLLLWIDQDLCGGDHDVLNAVCRHCESKGAPQ